jgi:hypothetical protein
MRQCQTACNIDGVDGSLGRAAPAPRCGTLMPGAGPSTPSTVRRQNEWDR